MYIANTGNYKKEISKEEAQEVASRYMLKNLKIKSDNRIEKVDFHHEYRGRPLPVHEISKDLKAYVAVENGTFQTVRHRKCRWFDFLWMTHTMDYPGRDNFNSILLRSFSLLGLITVLSGFLLLYANSPSIRKVKKQIFNNQL